MEDLGRDRELADVVEQQSEPELVEPLVEAVELSPAAVVDPATLVEDLPSDQQAERGHVDRVLERVGVGGAQVGERQRCA